MTTGKTTALTIWTFIGKVMSLLFNMLPRLVVAFLPRSKHLLISWLSILFHWFSCLFLCQCYTVLRRRQWHPTPVLQYSMENPVDGGAWWAAVRWVATSWTRLSDFTFTFHFHALEKEMTTHSSVLAWKIPGMGEPGGLPSMGSHRVGHD